jgi:hypothetical protein
MAQNCKGVCCRHPYNFDPLFAVLQKLDKIVRVSEVKSDIFDAMRRQGIWQK